MVDPLGILISAMPFAVAAVGLAGLGWSASTAGGASLAVAVLGAVVWPDLEATAVPGALFGDLGLLPRCSTCCSGGYCSTTCSRPEGLSRQCRGFSGGWSPTLWRSRPGSW